MKKNTFVAGVSILVFVALLAFSARQNRREMPLRLRIATGGESGVYYSYGEAIAEVLEKKFNVPVTAQSSGGSVENLRLARQGRVELAFVQNDIMTYAYNGTDLFSTEGPFREFSAVAGLYPEFCQIVAGRNIEKIQDLAGKKISIGDEGSGTEQNALQILNAYGLSYTDILPEHLSFAGSVAAFKEGKIDAFFCTAGVPTPAITDLAASGKAHLLSVGEAHARALISRYPYYSWQTIEAGVYPGIEEQAETVALQATLIASDKLDGQTVFEILETLFGERAALSRLCEKAELLDPETAVNGIPIPLHPGAEKYFFKKK